MTEQEAIDVVYEGLAGVQSIPVKLRKGQGLDRERLAKVKEAMRLLIERWRDKDSVPKRVAGCFVDLGTLMDWGHSRYSEREQEEIQSAGMALVELAQELFEEPEAEQGAR